MPFNYPVDEDDEDCNSCDTLKQIQSTTKFPSFVPKPSTKTSTNEKTSNIKDTQTVNTIETEEKNINEDFVKEGLKKGPIGFSELGHTTWALLHTIAAYYPNKPSEEKQQQTSIFFKSLPYVYPCKYCADDLLVELEKSPPKVGNQQELSLWVCDLHNVVNEKLGKPIFPCEFVDQRWKPQNNKH